MKIYTFDLEIFKNFFCAVFKERGGEFNTFEISDCKVDINGLKEFISGNLLIGYNNQSFDNLLLNYILRLKKIPNNLREKLKDLTDEIIYNSSRNLLYTLESTKSLIRYKLPYKSIDLMSILGFGKRISLKQIAVNIKWHNIQDLPKSPDALVENSEIDGIIKYCKNDVLITEALLEIVIPEIKLREQIGKEYGIDVLNASNSKMGDILMSKFYSDFTSLKHWEYKNQRTIRDSVRLGDCISDNINFKSDKLNKLLFELKQVSIEL